jgi:hypothetical protein
MRQAGIEGIYRRRKRGCNRRDPAAIPSDDLVNRRFSVTAPDNAQPRRLREDARGMITTPSPSGKRGKLTTTPRQQ